MAATAIVSSTATTAMAAAPASQDKPANVFVKRGQVAKFAASSTFKINLPKGDHAVLTPRGLRVLNADEKVVGGMTRLDVMDKAGHVHKATWSLEGNQLTQTIADVKKGSTIEGTVVRPTPPGPVTVLVNWNCFWDGVGTVGAGLGVIGSVAGAPATGGASLAATGGLLGGTAMAARGFKDCF
ncbi:hypothetical protein [Streptomyces halobius]|uniref:Uncharacterized protein n=1 Tax=Streptomyces halobius TaxID=2879846 RepID=A0ABY4M1L3_9ACTN|nr:hypothetical protein [Streptomyces halobius]UQA91322.1 hypothetical protein K9S39_05000 [Streptomyces halobius]